MKKFECLRLNCCSEEKKCEVCAPDWARRYYVEIDEEKEGDDKYLVFFPLVGFDDLMRKNVDNFKPMVTGEGFWYLSQGDARVVYAGSDKEESIERTIEAIINHLETRKEPENEQ